MNWRILSLLLLTLAALGFFAWQWELFGLVPVESRRQAVADPSADPVVDAGAQTGPGAAGRAATEAAADAGRSRLAAGGSAATGWRVQVVWRETGEPVPEAQLTYPDPEKHVDFKELHRRLGAQGHDVEVQMETMGRTVRTDAGGWAQVPAMARFGYIIARKGEAYGQLAVEPTIFGAEGLRLEIGRDMSLELTLKTVTGRPAAGVEVWFQHIVMPQPRGADVPWTSLRPFFSGPEGKVRVANVESWILMPMVGRETRTEALRLWMQVPGCPPQSWMLGFDELSGGCMRHSLRLAPTGALLVEVLDGDGIPVRAPCRLRLLYGPEGEAPRREQLYPDEEVRIGLSLPMGQPVLRGRLLSPSGRPLEGELRLRRAGERADVILRSSRQEGRLLLSYDPAELQAALRKFR